MRRSPFFICNLKFKKSFWGVVSLLMLMIFVTPASAQNSEKAKAKEGTQNNIRLQAAVNTSVSLISGGINIQLWGLEPISDGRMELELAARDALMSALDDKPIVCSIRARDKKSVRARCVNHLEKDLSLFLIHQGYAGVKRDEVNGTLYAEPYLEAERRARVTSSGVWSKAGTNANNQNTSMDKFPVFLTIFLLIVIIGLIGISYYIMRGFKKVIEAQHHAINLAHKDREIKGREKFVVAAMLDAELKGNKAKTEAFLTIYEETLREFTDPDGSPRYQLSGEVVQRKPVLDRAVFDGNTNRLDLLDKKLATEIINYYSSIESRAEFLELTPEMPVEEARGIVQSAVDDAKSLNDMSDRILMKLDVIVEKS